MRVPYTLNSKCIAENKDPEVKVIQNFDNSEPLSSIDNLLVEFMTFLADRKLKTSIEIDKRKIQKDVLKPNNISSPTAPYVEKLLWMSLIDYRKYVINLILAPYFVNIIKLSDKESFSKIKEWALRCNSLEQLKPSVIYFDIIIKNAIKRAKITGIKPLKFKDTLQLE